jgi:hypothetical protein
MGGWAKRPSDWAAPNHALPWLRHYVKVSHPRTVQGQGTFISSTYDYDWLELQHGTFDDVFLTCHK